MAQTVRAPSLLDASDGRDGATICATAAAPTALRFERMSFLWALLLLAKTTAAPPSLPAVVGEYLARHSESRIPSLDDVAPDDADERAALRRSGLFRPTTRADVTGDGRPDLLVLLLVRQAGGRYYELVAFHATAEGFEPEPHLVHRESVDALVGVQARPDGRVLPLFCPDCDSSLFYRWNGSEYEANLFRDGEDVTLLRDARTPVVLRAEPRADAGPRASVAPCTRARVIATGARDADGVRWYEVAASTGAGRTPVRGHVTGESLSADPVCLASPR